MAERSLRGMSIGAKSLESDENIDFVARSETSYICPRMHKTILPFADGADIPQEWECHCGLIAKVQGEHEADEEHATKPVRTHWDMLRERRSIEELSALLDKRLQMHHDGWIPDYE